MAPVTSKRINLNQEQLSVDFYDLKTRKKILKFLKIKGRRYFYF